ncbi:MAG: hypothetical protein M1818_004844 [Claussenomyces sp. TS43310]|nr:MAG: hypothetical protein M1818_004844 [Claussenomyces sp. TS43310]
MARGSEIFEPLADKTVLVTGSQDDRCRRVAEKYGFKNVVTPADIVTAYPTIWPFNEIWTDYYTKSARPLPLPINPADPSGSLKIDAMFIFNDPRDWALDTQIILDLLLSRSGILGTYSTKNGDPSLPNRGFQQEGQPSLFFSNPDLFWAAAYHLPRLGQGGFRSAFDGVWAEVTGGASLTKTVIGKPYAQTYHYAERVLQTYRNAMLGASSELSAPKLDHVFMIGDNPESDIRGANEFDSPDGVDWTSILVKTGVYRKGTEPKYEPAIIVDDVLMAVKWALDREGYHYEPKDLVHDDVV